MEEVFAIRDALRDAQYYAAKTGQKAGYYTSNFYNPLPKKLTVRPPRPRTRGLPTLKPLPRYSPAETHPTVVVTPSGGTYVRTHPRYTGRVPGLKWKPSFGSYRPVKRPRYTRPKSYWYKPHIYWPSNKVIIY